MNSALLVLAMLVPQAAEKPIAIKGVHILTAAGDEIATGTVVIKEGKIEAVGADAAVPAGAEVVDGKGCFLMPGLIHPATRIGSSPSGSGNAPDHLAIEELAPSLDAYRPVVRAGFTTLALFPAGGPIAGQAVAFKPRGVARDQMSILSPAYLRLEMEASTRVKEQIRLAWEGAKRLKDKKDSKPDDRSAPLVQFLKGELRAQIEIRSPGEYLHFRQILKPFEDPALKFAIVGSPDLWRGAEALGARKEMVLLRPNFGLTPDNLGFVPDTRVRVNPAAELSAAGCIVGFLPGDNLASLETHLLRAAQCVKAGFARDLALKALTIVPATAAGVDKRVGSIEKGKDADLLLLDADPFSGAARILKVYIDGKVEHEVLP
jgi:hypothetical protein